MSTTDAMDTSDEVKAPVTTTNITTTNVTTNGHSNGAASSSSSNVPMDDDSDSEDDVPLGQLLARKTQSGPSATKPVVKKEPVTPKKRKRDDDDDDDDIPLGKLVAKAKVKKEVSVKKEARADDDDDDDDLPLSVLAKRAAEKKRSTPAKKKAPAKKKGKAVVKKEVKKPAAKKRKGNDTKAVKKEPAKKKKAATVRKPKKEEPPVRKWWNEDPLPEGTFWLTLSHNGILFAPDYEPHGVKLLYDGKGVALTPPQEEVATFYARYLETDHVKKPLFRKNFFAAFKKLLNPKGGKEKHVVQLFDKCDFSLIHAHLMAEKESVALLRKEKVYKDKTKAAKEKELEQYGYAMVDGFKERISNFKVEIPGLFLGRGEHPQTGMLKKRIMPEDVTLNLDKDAPIPKCPCEGHKWGKIVHDNTVTWLAGWKDHAGHHKYVFLAASSRVKGESDMKKFEKARQLGLVIGDIRKAYQAELKSEYMSHRQRATATWLIDVLALRVGNEKNDDEADTVGCCSIRVEHVNVEVKDTVTFDFLGKDSMRYFNTVQVPSAVYRNFKLFCKKKEPQADLFDKLTPSSLNEYLKQFMDGLSAKVFRTYNASYTLEKELAKVAKDIKLVEEKVLEFNRANRAVAILCNHQRSLPKTFEASMGKIDDKIADIKQEMATLRKHAKLFKAGKELPPPKKLKEGETAKRWPSDLPKTKKALERCRDRVKKWGIKKLEKDDLKTVSLGTSKINYCDPRVAVAWCKAMDVPIEKIYSRTLREKFPWAMDVDEKFSFIPPKSEKKKMKTSSSATTTTTTTTTTTSSSSSSSSSSKSTV
eukprot:TRINITY_DN4494_c0_g2_i3.p1 TRINITY_DN4494_c0_g2~~TRINITY_DN4494_c0_g2_i3.p1  ORF type:complete len:815 (-),score=342.35 TRINITY_DN4494_c0_g2_i3:1433-3877(-)